MSSENQKQTLVDQRLALGVYLDNLLSPSEQEMVPKREPQPESKNQVRVETKARVEVPLPVILPTPEVKVTLPDVKVGSKEKTHQAVATSPPLPPADGPIAHPDWAKKRFQCLIFQVEDVVLAAPLVKLNSVLNTPREITPMPGHEPWFVGLVQYHGKKVKVIDTALLIVPSHRHATLPPLESRMSKLVLIGDYEWALACNRVAEIVTLEESDIKWRTEGSKQKWFFGMVTHKMCALVDVDQFVFLLKKLSKGLKDITSVA